MRKKMIGIFVCMLLIGTVLPVSGTVLMERTSKPTFTGNTLYVGGSGPGNYSTIQEAIDAASDGDTIFIYSGTYHPDSNIHVYKELQIMGESKEGVIVEKEIGSEELSIRSINVVVTQITFINFMVSNQIQFDNLVITDNNFIVNNDEGHWNPTLILISGDNNEFSNNVIERDVISQWSRNPSVGVCFQCYNSLFVDNIIIGRRSDFFGLHILDRTFWADEELKGLNLFEGNTFSNNEYGIYLNPNLNPKYRSKIIHNNFIDNAVNAKFCITLPSVVDIIKNTIKKAETGFTLGLVSDYWDENYWDDYDGSGPMRISGTIQTAGIINNLMHYVFPWINFDRHPLQEPYDI